MKGDMEKNDWSSKGLLFDLTSAELATKSLSGYIKRDAREVLASIKQSCDDDYAIIYNKFLEKLAIDLEELSLNNVELKSLHVTTGNDNGEVFLKNGILNLRQTIEQDTPLSRFLGENQISINIKDKILTYRGKQHTIKDNFYGVENNFVYHKLYRDYLINGFHCNEDPISYGGYVAYKPEIIASIGKFIKNIELEYKWKDIFNQCYIIEYKASPYNYEWFNFQIDGMVEEDFKANPEYYIKKWMIRQAIGVIISQLKGWELPEIYSYMKFEYNVPSSDILRVRNVTEDRNNR